MFKNFTKYEVYEDGRIWSYSRKKFLKPHTTKDGYQQVRLSDNEGESKWYRLNRVVYEAVSGEPIPEGLQVNHRNEDKTDNRFFENLNLMTPKENCNFGSRNARVSKANSKQVGAFQNDELIMSFSSTNEAEMLGFNHSHISDCCNGNRKTHKGFQWKYINEKET